MIDSWELLRSAAKLLAGAPAEPPSQSDLRRVVSTAYYALFHRILREGADRLAKADPDEGGSKAWSLVYRAYSHGLMADRCGQIAQPPPPLVSGDFTAATQELANLFRALQRERHQADYDPLARFEVSFVAGRIAAVVDALRCLDAMAADEATLFVAFLLFGARRQGG